LFSTEHFRMAEFLHSDTAVRHKLDNTPSKEHGRNLRRTMQYMEVIRSELGYGPIKITSGYRSPKVNALVGGVPDSDHALGYACDFYFVRWPIHLAAPELATALVGHPTIKIPFDQFILEKDRGVMHISFHPRARKQILTQLGAAGSKIVKGIR